MPDLHLVYIVGFNTDRSTGRNNATKNKRDEFRKQLDPGSFKFYQLKGSQFKILEYFFAALFDLQLLLRCLTLPNYYIILQRQTILPLTNTLLRLRKIKIVYELHTDLSSELQFLDKSPVEKFFIRLLIWFEDFNLKICSGIIINNPSLETFIKKYNKPFRCIYNGVNPREFFPIDKEQCRQQLGLRLDAQYFLFAGMLSKWHGVELLIDIWKDPVLRDSPNHILLIIGAKDDRFSNYLKDLAEGQKNVKFIEFLSIEILNRYINAADICLLPVNDIRTNLSSPLKLYEYAACGKPIITQDNTPGYSDEVLNLNLGLVLDFTDAPESAKMLLKCSEAIDKYFKNISFPFYWKNRIVHWIIFLRSIVRPPHQSQNA